jgi:ABC-type spermidine/putrescine transport system permease subunit I
MGIVFWQWMATLLVALVGYPLAYMGASQKTEFKVR